MHERQPGTGTGISGAGLRLLFDGNWWVRGPISNRSVQRAFIHAWARCFPEDELLVAVPAADAGAARDELASAAEVVPTHLSPQGLSAIVELPLLARRHRAELTLTHNFTPLVGRSAVFVHDFLFLSNPEWFTRKERLYFSLMPATVSRAEAVFTSSKSEARRIARFAARASSPVAVGMGLSSAVEGAATPVAGLQRDRFVLTVGRLNTRKNLTAITAAALRSGAISPRFPLVVVGEASGRASDLPKEAAAAVADGSIVLLGRVDDAALRWLYRSTALFLFLSLDEGFGMPTLEALHADAPLLVSDIPVFREILGSDAAFVDPRDVGAIAGALDAALTSPPPAPNREQILERYTWERSVAAMRATVLPLITGGASR
jgi:glycosyltransferase involved in cell wall biosynthesis